MTLQPFNPALTPEERRRRELQQYIKVGHCVNGVAHDVNNCLGAILAYAELASLDPTVNAETQRMIGRILESVERASRLIGELTNVARPVSDAVGIIDLGAMMQNVAMLREYDFRMQQLVLHLDIPPNVPSLAGNPAQIRLALLYLLMHLEETAMNLGNKEIHAAISVAQQGLELTFRNSGPSQSAEEVTAMLQTLDSQGHDPGFGAGIQHARQIIEAHNGSFEYDPNRGFVVLLPYYTENDAQARDNAAPA